jgi:pSer/pThr/pTyr-binding forkhead associated (FHA) protein
MMLRLQHLRPDGEVDTYHLKSGRRYTLGRGSSCEVRILDLKLSRAHCAVEYANGEWRVLDLGSTNGCKVDGDLIAGSAILKHGTRIDIGATTLTVLNILGDDEVEDDEAAATAVTTIEPGTGATVKPAARPANETTSATVRPANRTPAPQTETKAASLSALEARPAGETPRAPAIEAPAQVRTPQPAVHDPTPRSPLKPVVISAAPLAADPAPAVSSDNEPTMLAAPAPAPEPPPAQPPTERQEGRTFFITVLGRRVGPLTRVQARDLKARELKGTLTTGDLADLPQPG